MNDSLHYYYNGMELLENGNFELAIEYFEKSTAISPHYKTYERLAACFNNIGKVDEYRKYIELAFKYNPKSDKTAVEYAFSLQSSGEIDEAERILSLVLSRNRTYGPAIKLFRKIECLK